MEGGWGGPLVRRRFGPVLPQERAHAGHPRLNRPGFAGGFREAQEMICGLLAESPTLSIRSISKRLGHGHATTWRYLQELGAPR